MAGTAADAGFGGAGCAAGPASGSSKGENSLKSPAIERYGRRNHQAGAKALVVSIDFNGATEHDAEKLAISQIWRIQLLSGAKARLI